jgi:Cu+-exporting ATPase
MSHLPDATHHHPTIAWPATRQARLGVIAGALVVLALNATGTLTELFKVNTALFVIAVGAYPLAMRAMAALRSRQITYDVTIAVAALIATAAGEFVAAAEVIFIVLIGDALEHWAIHRADRAIANFMSLQPNTASVVRNGREQQVPTSEVSLADRVVVRGGERIPVDGTVIDGEAAVDQSLVTGESVAVRKSAGAQVFCGTILEHGALEIRPELVGQDTTIARVARLVADARRRRPHIVRTADRVSRIFLPAVLVSAAVVYVLTGEALRSAAVLLVACSCALVYAAPAAFAAALARLARGGVLVKGGDTLEALSTVTAVAFDKTGTLTIGHPSVTLVTPADGSSADEVLRWAGSVEHLSEHALGRAIVAEARARHLNLRDPEAFQSRPGLGVRGRVGGHDVCVGSIAFLRETLPALGVDIERLLAQSGRAGETPVLVAVDGTLAGLIALQDVSRADAADGIAALKTAGIKNVYLLTGDERAVADAVAAQVGIDPQHVYANLLPDEKLHRIRELADAGARVLMIGDGVNDAPSLAAAHVGAAFGRGAADLSAEAAQVVMLEPRIDAIRDAIVVARKTVERVRFNIIAFAAGVNVLAILAAGLGYLKPTASAVLHQLVSLVVILGSVSLLFEHRIRDVQAWMEWRRSLAAPLASWTASATMAARGWMARHSATLATAGITLAILLWMSSGVLVIGPGETAAVLRFGRLVDARLGPGLHLRAPWPIDRVTRVFPRRVRTVEIGFRSSDNPAAGPLDLEWNTAHGEGQVQRVPDENLVLTGDENMSELYAVVHYAIADPARHLFGIRDGDALVRMIAEGSLRALTAGYPLETLLTTDRHQLEQRWAETMRARLVTMNAGVEVLGIYLADVHPPVDVVNAFRDVASAEEEEVMKMNEAEAYSMEAIPLARGSAAAQLEEAAGYRSTRVRHSQGDAARFLARLAHSTGLTTFRLQMETLESVLVNKRLIITDDHKGAHRGVMFVGDGDLLKALGVRQSPGLYSQEER